MSITEDGSATDQAQVVEEIKKKTLNLQTQQTLAMDYLNDIEAALESWHSDAELNHGGSISVLDNLEEEEQERAVQELIQIDRSIGKLVLLIEKLDLQVDKNERLLHKATLKIKSESLIKLCEEMSADVSEQNKQAIKLESRLL